MDQNFIHALLDVDKVNLRKFAELCYGFSPSDILLFKEKTIQTVEIQKQLITQANRVQGGMNKLISEDMLYTIKSSISPLGLSIMAPEVPVVTWNDIGGLENVKSHLKESTIWIYQHKDKLERMGLSTGNTGILLYGPPGTGKTTLVKAVANESHANFLSFSTSDLIMAEVGESEKKIAEIFSTAHSHSPCIVFFDEIQSVFGSRGGTADREDDLSEYSTRLIAQLLIEMQGIKDRQNVIVIAATNSPELIDPALLRSGRFDKLIYVPPPDDVGRREIFKIALSKMVLEESVLENEFLSRMVEKTKNATGAEIVNLCLKAGLNAFSRNMNCKRIERQYFEDVLSTFTPQVTDLILQKLRKFGKII